MHNIDRTMSMEAGDFESGDFESGDFESDGLGYEGDFESSFEFEAEINGQAMEVGGLSEEDEVDLAAELLTITNEDELDQFLGNLFRRVGRGIRGIARNPVFRAVGGMLKGVAKRVLPMAGAALGSVVPGVGTAIGGALGTAASKLFEVDLESMSDEDAQFEVARRWVRLAGDTVQQASRVAGAADPQQAARQALAAAARRHAPGLARALGSRPRMGREGWSGAQSTGRWIRRGRHIVVLGV